MKKIILILLTLFICFSFISCDFGELISNNGSNTSNTNTDSTLEKNTEGNNVYYKIAKPTVPSYSTVTTDNVCVYVANVALQSTVEISCTINYQYTVLSYNFRGQVISRTYNSSSSCLATGFVINEDGYIMTNAHVVCVENSSSYTDIVYTSRDIKVNYADTNVTFDCEVVAYDEDLDLCILKMDTSNITELQYLTFLDLTDPRDDKYSTTDAIKLLYGETAIAVGNAGGYGMSVTKGVVSAPYKIFDGTYAIQTDAAINSGNSGGPLLNSYAAVIGINSFKIVTSTSESLGFAIPSYVVLKYIDSVNETLDTKVKTYVTTDNAYVQK